MARVIITLSDESSMADVAQLIKEVKRKSYVIDAWSVKEEDYAAQHSVQRTATACDHSMAEDNNPICPSCMKWLG